MNTHYMIISEKASAFICIFKL